MTSTPTLEGARAKIVRASRHIDELDALVSPLVEEALSSVDRAFLLERDRTNVYSIRSVRALPREASTITGDAFFNLRSAGCRDEERDLNRSGQPGVSGFKGAG